VRAEKAALRQAMRAIRAGLDPSARAEAHAAIVRSVVAFALERGDRVIALYAGSADEADPSAAAAPLAAAGCRVVWPRVAAPARLAFHSGVFSELRPGFRGIAEPPPDAPAVAWEDIDLALIPGLAFTADGQRLGQGGGFYDRLLGTAPRPFALGIAYAAQVLADLPAEAHDQPVDRAVTEQGFVTGGDTAPACPG
jgi:5-formyltetrahydrofolate cyclo-ligase